MPFTANSNSIQIRRPGLDAVNKFSVYSETYRIYLGQSATYPVLRTLLNTNDSNGYKYGDTNNDGSITLTDVLNGLKWYLNQGLTASYTQAVKDRLDAIAAIITANKETYKADNSYYEDPLIFSTDYRMPHIVSSVHGTFTTQNAACAANGSTVLINSKVNIYADTSSNYVFANSFVWCYLKPLVNRNRTELNVGNPIFITGSTIARLYIQDKAYRGALIYTPRVWDGYIGFEQETTYNYTGAVPPTELWVTSGNSNPGITFEYTLYYGRFI